MKPIILLSPWIQAANPLPVPDLVPVTEEEKRLYEGALRRRQLRLILGGKMKPEDAGELKALFFQLRPGL